MNKKHLISKKPKRLITFGCSFTNYYWITWPEILAHSLDCDLYNFAMSGNSNALIHNTIMQADSVLDFNSDDLIMICWSGILRDAKFVNGWWRRTTINENFDLFGKHFLKEMVEPFGYLLETMASIKSSSEFIKNKGSTLHEFSMSGILIDEAKPENSIMTSEQRDKIIGLYKPYISKLLPSMCDILYGTPSSYPKVEQMRKFLNRKDYMDTHPTPEDHLRYLETVFDITINDHTKKLISDYLPGMYEIMKTSSYSGSNPWQELHTRLLSYKDKNYIWENKVNNYDISSKIVIW